MQNKTENAIDRLSMIAQLARDQFRADVAFVGLPTKNGGQYVAKSGGLVVEPDIPLIVDEFETCMAGRVRHISDLSQDGRYRDHIHVSGDPSLRFYADAPIVLDGEVRGVLCILDPTPNEKLPQDAHLLVAMAEMAAGPLADIDPGALEDIQEKHYLEAEVYDLFRGAAARRTFNLGFPDGAWYWDLNKPEHEWMSERFWRTLGYDPADMPHLAAAWQDMINTDDLEVALDNFNKHCADPSHPYDQIVRYRHKDGSTVHVRCRGFVVRDEEGQPRRMIGAHTDVTTLVNQQEELEQLNQYLSDFAYIAAHDLQAPARQTAMLLEAVEMALQDEGIELSTDVKELLSDAENSARRMKTMVRSLNSISRLKASSLARETINVNECIQLAQDQLAPILDETRAEIVVGDIPNVSGEKALLIQLFQNLIENACHYAGDAPPKVRISAKSDAFSSLVVINVEDEGTGIPDAQHEKVFQPFQRYANRTVHDGSGIGLALCRRIVQAHGGSIRLLPGSDTGAKFQIRLPV